MRLYDRLPDRVKVGRKTYRINLDFRNVLRLFDTLTEKNLMPEARQYLALRCVMRRPPKRRTGEAFAAVMEIIAGDRHVNGEQKKVMSFEQDADLILAAFRQAYGIDLYHDKVHWLAFRALLAGLPEGSRYAEVVSIRSREIPMATKYNSAEISWLMKAKAAVQLKLTDEEREASMRRTGHETAMSLLAYARAYAPKGGDENGS